MGELATYNVEATTRDPSRIAYPATLPIELALKTASPDELRAEYRLSIEEWEALRFCPAFQADLVSACALVKKEGMSFKLRARMQAEALLQTSWKLIHAPSDEVAPSVKADLIKTTFRVAGFDTKDTTAAGVGGGLNIQINL